MEAECRARTYATRLGPALATQGETLSPRTGAYVPRSPIRRTDKRRAQILGDIPWLLSVAVLVVFALTFQLYPSLTQQSAVGVAFPPLAVRAWAGLMLAGCIMIFVGVWKIDARWDVAGSLTLAGWALSYSYAVFAIRGASVGFVACSMFSAYFAVCIARAFVLAYEPQVKSWRSRR